MKLNILSPDERFCCNTTEDMCYEQAKLTLEQLLNYINLTYDGEGELNSYPTQETWQALKQLTGEQ